MFKKTVLKNGLRIITVPQKQNTGAVTILVLVGAGSKYETEKENGISHFLEHMFFKGTKKRASQLKVAEALDGVGGAYNAFTGKECTGYWAKTTFEHFDLALDWISDIFLNSKFQTKDIEKEKRVIVEEINMYLDTPQAYIWDLWEKLLYEDQSAGRSILGKKKNILKLKRQDLLNYSKNHYSAENTIICIAGKIEPSSAIRKVSKYFKEINRDKPKIKPGVSEKQEKPNKLIYEKDTDQTHLCLGVRAYDLFDPRKYIQALLARTLGGMMSSRLFTSVRGRGLAYDISTYSKNYTDTGYLVTQAGVAHENTERTVNLILREYKDIKEKKIGNDELKKAKEYLKGKLILGLESSESQASFYGSQELSENKILTPEQIIDRINKISSKDVLSLAQNIFVPNKLNLVIIGPSKNKVDFEKLLKF